jgi:1-acyl-sn-glycerol-3-phosphate acyltransferase
MRSILRRVFYLFFRIFIRLTVTGIENIPREGGCLLTGNHLDIIDAPLFFCLIPRDDATGLAALKHRRNPLFRFVVESAKGIWIDRTRPDFQALKTARTHLKNGGLLGLAPEGTRSENHALIIAKPGVAFLADKSNATILPSCIIGSENSLKKIFTLQRPKVRVQFGEPFHLPPLDRKDRESSLRRNTDEIMCRIAALLPIAYRGVYADHPRLKELLGE